MSFSDKCYDGLVDSNWNVATYPNRVKSHLISKIMLGILKRVGVLRN